MPLFRCDFIVRGDLVLPPGIASEKVRESAGVVITFRNHGADADGNALGLLATVIADAPDMMAALTDHRLHLAESLDLLAFCTHSRFQIEQATLAVEWTPHMAQREMRVVHQQDSRYPPSPELRGEFIRTISEIRGANPAPYVLRAMRAFRGAMSHHGAEDQFMKFWLSLEIVAENTRSRTRVKVQCRACQETLLCSSCGSGAERVPTAFDRIRELAKQAEKVLGDGLADRMFLARHGLMHGRAVKSIEDEAGVPVQQLVNEIAAIAWHSIMGAISVPPEGDPLALGDRGWDFSHINLLAVHRLTFSCSVDKPHPSEAEMPRIETGVSVSFQDQQNMPRNS